MKRIAFFVLVSLTAYSSARGGVSAPQSWLAPSVKKRVTAVFKLLKLNSKSPASRHYRPLSRKEVKQVHLTSLRILEEAGIEVVSEQARKIFKDHGCEVDPKTNIVKIPAKIVEKYRKKFVPTFTFKGRDPKFDRTLPNDSPIMVTASSAPNIVDPVSGDQRRATSADIAAIAFLVDQLKGYDVFSISTLADDAPEGQYSLYRFYSALKNTLKPVRGNTPNMKELRDVLELGYLIAGGKEAYLKRPLITHHLCPVVSPLKMDKECTDQMIYLTKEGLPAYVTIAPAAGTTAPMSLQGPLALANAEFLASNVLRQMIKPKTPTIYAVLSTFADMRSGDCVAGGIETGVLQMAHSQMARYYKVPSGGYIGLTGSHLNDAQAGYQTGIGTTGAVLAGTDMLNTGGLLSNLTAFDYGKAVTDGEIALMLKRMKKGFGGKDFSRKLDEARRLIKKVGPSGSYLAEEHTFNNFRSALLLSVSSRESLEKWREHGAKSTQSRASSLAAQLLEMKNPAVWSTEVDNSILDRFPDLHAEGDAR
jgi:trimethylamine--corrinoid protein Co-methyltransferase